SGGSAPPPPPPPPPPGDCTGFTGEYFNNIDLGGVPALTRCDAEINFTWPGATGAGAGLDGTYDSTRWTRTVDLPAGDHTFTITGDDGVRVKLDGAIIIDAWKDQGPSTYMATRNV
ncbi:PA14 domain-containing protein, partial [Escherichia coli]|uniref:PA14 domain-containing protein n=1 Tax=Escherichia coli TaxID=562 RepID=UPI0032E47CA1